MNKKTILIVDDTYENLYLLKVILEEAGYNVMEASDGSQGLEKLHENSDVDLIISDILMPIMDGYLFCQACKKDEIFKKIPFVFYTSNYTEELDEEFALKLGATQFLRKPIDHDELLFTVNEIIASVKTKVKPVDKASISENEVLKLYSERLINKLEQKSVDLGNEVLERKKAEQLLTHKNQILDLISVNTPLDKIFDQLLLNFESVHPGYFGCISLLDEDGIHLNLVAGPSLPKAYSLAVKRIAIGENVGSCGTAAFFKKSVIVSDISTDRQWLDYKHIALKYGLKSCWSIPIFSKDKSVLGTFAIYSKSINTPSLEDVHELNFTVNLVNIAFEKSIIVAEIKRKDASYRSLIDQASDIIITYSLDGTIHDFNKAAYVNLGYTKKEFLKFNIQDFSSGYFIQNQENYKKLLAGEAILFDRDFKCKDNSIIYAEISARLQKDGKILGIARDVTDWRNNLIEIKKEKEFSSGLLKAMNEGLVVLNLDSEIISVNPSFCKMTGFSEKELIGCKRPYPFLPPEFNKENDARYQSFLDGNMENEFEFVYAHKSGLRFPVHVLISSLYDSDGNKTANFATVQNITERKKAQLKLEESEYSLRQSQKVANIGSYIIDINTMTWDGSEVLDDIFGIPKTFVKTIDNWLDLVHPDEREEMFNYLKNGILNNIYFNREYRVIKRDSKKEIWVHGIGELLFDTEGAPIKLIGTMQDITYRKQSEIKLQQSEFSLRQSQVVANIGSYEYDIIAGTFESSAMLDVVFGIDESYEKTTEGWTVLIHPDEREDMLSYLEHCILNNTKFNKEYKVIKQDSKEEIWVHGIGEFILDSKANPITLIGTIQDITDRKKAELDLKIANDFSSSLLASMHEGLFAINLDSVIISVNPSFCKMTGFTEQELIGVKRPYPFSPPENRKANDARYKLLLENKNKKDYENTYMRKNGERFPVHVLVSSVYDEKGVKTANFATVEDITERKKAEINLQLAKEFNDKLVMSMQEGLLILDMLGKINKVNDSFCKMIGYSEQELIGLELPFPFAKTEDLIKMQGLKASVENEEAPSFQLEFIRKNGEQFLASFLTGTIKDNQGEVIAIFATIKDVSEEEKAKKVLEENAQKSNQKKKVILELASLVGTDPKKAFEKITALASETLHVSRVGVWSFNKNKNEIHCQKLFDSKNQAFENGAELKENEHPNYFEAIFKNKIISIDDARCNSVTKSFAQNYLLPLDITSMMDIVIHVSNDMYGVLCFEHVGPERKWSTEEEEFATSIANLVSLMVESSERQLAENETVLANEKLSTVNLELNSLRKQLELENVYLRNELDLVFNYEEMVYGSAEFSNVLSQVEQVAPTNATVLLLGESGTGKELLARAIHNTSLRNNKPLIKVNCSAIPRELIESELFGHKKGSFTGAISDKIGKFELAHGGTLFLDEIGEMPLDMQPKILRFLQEGEIEVVGGVTGLKKLDVRVIAATNKNLQEEIEKKLFREDLFFRLHVFPIHVPPLRERREDIPLLVEHFVDKFNKAYGKSIQYITDDAMSQLKAYTWPGNIRELENLIERASILSSKDTLVVPGFESTSQKTNTINNKDLSLDAVQRNHIIQILEQCNWKISGANGAAVLLKLKPSTLRDRMTKLGISKVT